MPGKYSHSVVLADYTTRGIISLPEDQYERYKEFRPTVPGNSSPIGKLSRSRSAQPIYQPPTTSQDGWDTVDLSKAKQSLSANTTPIRARGTEHDSKIRQRSDPRLLDSYRERTAKSTSAVNHERQTHGLTAYQRQQQLAAEGSGAGTSGKKPLDYWGVSNPERSFDNTSSRLSESSPKIKKDIFLSNTDERPQLLGNSQAISSSSSRTLKGLSRSDMPTRKFANEPDTSNVENTTGQVDSPRMTDLRGVPTHQKPFPITPTTSAYSPSYKTPPAQLGASLTSPMNYSLDQVGRSRSSESRISRSTQIWSPKPKPDAEPNFDGFSDKDDGPESYFDVPKQFPSHSRDSSANSALPIQRPESREEQPIASPLMSSVRSDRDPNTPSEATVDSSYYQRSASSKSSTSVPHGVNKNVESSRSPQQQSLQERSWALPEIKEDLGFSPSIFEDHEGTSSTLKLDFLDLELSIGQISSGKDVDFDNDAASELSAALPPPISRFKDEEDEFNNNMAKMFGGGGNEQALKKGSMTVGRRASSRKGFFSKFRSKS